MVIATFCWILSVSSPFVSYFHDILSSYIVMSPNNPVSQWCYFSHVSEKEFDLSWLKVKKFTQVCTVITNYFVCVVWFLYHTWQCSRFKSQELLLVGLKQLYGMLGSHPAWSYVSKLPTFCTIAPIPQILIFINLSMYHYKFSLCESFWRIFFIWKLNCQDKFYSQLRFYFIIATIK